MNDANKAFEERAKQLFDESVDGLDAATLSRLNQARQQALAASTRRMPSLARWAPIGGLATAAAVALLLIQSPTTIEVPDDAGAVEFELLLSEDSLDMLEDLEFYEWMDLADDVGGDSVG